MPLHDYSDLFPLKQIRSIQKDAIDFIIDSFEKGTKVVILDAGTGTGKSSIGVTVARYLQKFGAKKYDLEGSELTGAYILTTQKILQEQYVTDFGQKSKTDLLRSIKSSSNYRCKFYTDQSCAESRRVLNKLGKLVVGTDFHKCCKGSCTYALEKRDFVDSPISITNFSYFLAETIYAGTLKPRQLLIVDEAHNIESELGKFTEVTFSERFAKDIIKCKIPRLDSQDAVFNWIKGPYLKSLTKHTKEIEKLIHSKFNQNSDISNFSEQSKQYEMLDKHICKINRFVTEYDEKNWVMNIIKPLNSRQQRKFEFKPIDVSRYGDNLLFKYGGQVLLMSATIVNKQTFCETTGLNPDDVDYIRIPSPFPVENRPIHYIPVGSMSRDSIDKTLPIMVETIKMLLEQHSKEKGIIHCVSFKTAQFITNQLKSSRILIHDSNNRDDVLKFHLENNKPTVLLSPSMTEGVDLVGDSSRFQILCKVPYPYLGDLVIKKRMQLNKSWYGYQTAKSITQAFGRSIRNETDHAISYILDSDWKRFINENKHMFPEEFLSAIIK
jgi:Rad3-related DNA helicase